MTKFRYSIRTRSGSLVSNLQISGRDPADAERKLRQMYMNCEILDCVALPFEEKSATLSFEDIANLIAR